MSQRGINILVGLAVVSDEVKQGLMNGQRAALLRDPRFELRADEAAALMAIEADSFADFAAQVEALLEQGLSREEPVETAPPANAPSRWQGVSAAGRAWLPH
jgi:hypothetical protein